jgi:hypothetical protein
VLNDTDSSKRSKTLPALAISRRGEFETITSREEPASLSHTDQGSATRQSFYEFDGHIFYATSSEGSLCLRVKLL